MPAFIHIQSNGANLPGRSQTMELAGVDLADYTEIYSFFQESNKPSSGSHAGQQTTHAVFGPFVIVKGLDGISPRLLQSFVQNEAVNARLRFFDRNPADGVMRLGHEMTLTQCRITSIRHEFQPTPDTVAAMPRERITIAAGTIETLSPIGGSAEYMVNTLTSSLS